MKIIATPIKAKDLKPGDLFSSVGPDYWDHFDPLSIAERAYIRTNLPTPDDQANDNVYKLTIIHENS